MNLNPHDVNVQEAPGVQRINDTWTGRERCGIFFCWFCTLGLWFLALSKLGCNGYLNWLGMGINSWEFQFGGFCIEFVGYRSGGVWFWVSFGVMYLMYFINAATSPVRKYLSNQLSEPCKQYFAKLILAKPQLVWHIQCYHYETRTTTDSKGRTQTHTERVNTHSATSNYEFAAWKDITGAIQIPMGPNLLRLRLEKEKQFADQETATDYSAKFASFVVANDRDTHKDVSDWISIEGFHDYVLSRERHRSGCACFHRSLTFWIMTLLSFCPIYMHIFFCTTMPINAKIVKSVSMHPPAAFSPPTAAPGLPGLPMGFGGVLPPPGPDGFAPVSGYPLNEGVPPYGNQQDIELPLLEPRQEGASIY